MVHCAGWRCPASGESRLSCQYGYCVASLTPRPARVEDHGSMWWTTWATSWARVRWTRSLRARSRLWRRGVWAWGRARAFALEGGLDPDTIRSNLFTLEWPPRRGRLQSFPEV